MAWLAVDEDGREVAFSVLPHRGIYLNIWCTSFGSHYVKLPQGTIEKILGRKLTWSDEPVELTENNNTK